MKIRNIYEEYISKLNKENQEIKEELKESKLKNSKLNEYLEEKKIMEQKLQDNNNKVNKLKKSKNLIIRGLRKKKELKTKENNELKNEIKKLEKSKIELGGLPKLIEDIEKARTFAPPDNDREEELKKLLENKETLEDFDINELFRYE